MAPTVEGYNGATAQMVSLTAQLAEAGDAQETGSTGGWLEPAERAALRAELEPLALMVNHGLGQARQALTAWEQQYSEMLEQALRDQEKKQQVRVRFHIICNARTENVGKYQSCMVSKLRMIWKQQVEAESGAAAQEQQSVQPQQHELERLRTDIAEVQLPCAFVPASLSLLSLRLPVAPLFLLQLGVAPERLCACG